MTVYTHEEWMAKVEKEKKPIKTPNPSKDREVKKKYGK